ncbi:hypothetical protein C8Q75DRAFT_726585 [Abortiporus biennis]|nr:hypothetical protein C8Q75DRAFT_726585 [Abortiporus biennis]
MFAAQGVDVDAPRAKRHKPAPPAESSSDVAVKSEGNEGGDGNLKVEDPHVVKEKGLKLWQTVKDATNKEGRVLSHDFMRLPSRRQYADYYQLIKHPIALDDIKHKLDSFEYLTFEECKQDLETCFKNAKKYNIKESQIFQDAKQLHKLVSKEAASLSGTTNVADNGELHGEIHGSDAEGDGKKKKAPNMSRVLKTRLQKLIEKTDDSGRVRATEFMELPNKKQWPIYYKTIKKPQCLENIFKKLKRKEYHATLDFANDVELVFSNALEFNQEHTEIWEDAIVLRDYFRQLMSDLPAPFSIPAYASNDHSTKIKLKLPSTAVHQASPSNPPGPTLMLRLPQPSTTSQPHAPSATRSPALPPASYPQVTLSQPTPLVAPTTTNPPVGVQASFKMYTPNPQPTPIPTSSSATSQQATLNGAGFNHPQYTSAYTQHHYPNAMYQNTSRPTTAVNPATALPNSNAIQVPQSARHIPTPVTAPQQPVQLQIPSYQPPIGSLQAPLGQIHIQPQAQVTPVLQTPTTTTQQPIARPTVLTTSIPSKSPTPAGPVLRSLSHVTVQLLPSFRKLELDHKEGVKVWAIRLGNQEKRICVKNVKWLVEEAVIETAAVADESSDEETEHRKDGGDDVEMQDKEGDETQQTPVKRGRGRPRKNPLNPQPSQSPKSDKKSKGKGKQRAASSVAEETPTTEVHIKLNGLVVKPSTMVIHGKEEWEADLNVGMNVLEIGEKNGTVWRIHMDRMAF